MRRATLLLVAALVAWAVLAGLTWVHPGTRSRRAPSHSTGTKAAILDPRTAGSGNRARWVTDENAKPGSADWRITNTVHHGEIEGYADRTSLQRGDALTLYVSTAAPDFVVEAFRIGHYGGLGGRLVWRSPPVEGVAQPAGVRDPITNMVEAPWMPSTRIAVNGDWPPGVYLLKLVASTGAQSYVPVTVRDDRSTAAYVVQNSVTTWQAYNLWGGNSLYEGIRRSRSDFDYRSRVVSFDRPYAMGDGSGDFLGNEMPLVSLVESLGLDVTYWTDVDLHERPELLLHHRALLSLGHDEYWTLSMRQGAEAARDGGVNLAFFGANAVFRQIRLSDSALGPDRQVIGYKRAREDPYRGVNDAEVTVDWRDPPVSNPESTLVGNLYECNPVKADMVVADPSAWVFEGTGLQAGDRMADLVGPEYDRYTPSSPSPDNVQLLAHSPVRCKGQASYSDMTYYTAPSGAGVFATGTNWWISRLESGCHPAQCPPNDQVVRVTTNLLHAFGAGAAGRAHPSVPNYDQLAPAATTPSTSRSRSSRSGEPEQYFGRPPPTYREYYDNQG